MIRVSGLFVYPIKSARGIALSSGTVERRGFACDRRWMVVDEAGRFLTQRTIPRMALIRVALTSGEMLVSADGMKPLTLPLKPQSDERISVQIWRDIVEALDMGAESAAWFSTMLSRQCRLVYMPDESERVADPDYAPRRTLVSFADAFPFLLLSRATLEELNGRLREHIPMDRFRPNIVIEGCAPFEEDTWKRVRIGTLDFTVTKPCARCTVPTVNQDTGVQSAEPLRTLSSYRTVGNNVYFGQNLAHESEGMLNVADEVHVYPA